MREAEKWLISSAGGSWPAWSRAGRQLFYQSPDNYVMVVDYTMDGDTFLPGKPRRWADKQLRIAKDSGGGPIFDPAPDGKRLSYAARCLRHAGEGSPPAAKPLGNVAKLDDGW